MKMKKVINSPRPVKDKITHASVKSLKAPTRTRSARKKPLFTPKRQVKRQGLLSRCSNWVGGRMLKSSSSSTSPVLVSATIDFSSPAPHAPPRGCLVPWASVAGLFTSHFLHRNHYNLAGRDPLLGPVIVSVTFSSDPSPSSHILLRLTYGCFHLETRGKLPRRCLDLASAVCPALSLTSLSPLLGPATSSHLALAQDSTAALYKLLTEDTVTGGEKLVTPRSPKSPGCNNFSFPRIVPTSSPQLIRRLSNSFASTDLSFTLGSCFSSPETRSRNGSFSEDLGSSYTLATSSPVLPRNLVTRMSLLRSRKGKETAGGREELEVLRSLHEEMVELEASTNALVAEAARMKEEQEVMVARMRERSEQIEQLTREALDI